MKTPALKLSTYRDRDVYRLRVSGQGRTPEVQGTMAEMETIMENAPAIISSREVLIEYLQGILDQRARKRRDLADERRKEEVAKKALADERRKEMAAKKAAKISAKRRKQDKTPPRDREKVDELRSLGGHRSPDGQGGIRYSDKWAGIREHKGTYTSLDEALDVARSTEKPFLASTPLRYRDLNMTTPPASQAHLHYADVVDVDSPTD